MTNFIQAVLDGAQMGLIYALIAVGLTLIWGVMEMVNFAHGDFLMLGMIFAWLLYSTLDVDPLVSMVPLGVLFFGVGVVLYRVLMRRVQGGDVFTQIFATFGLLLFIQAGTTAFFSSSYRFLETTYLDRLFGGTIEIGPFVLSTALLFGGVIALLMFVGVYLVMTRSDLGLALQATAEDRGAVPLFGIDPRRMYAIAWGLGTASAVVAGVILSNFLAIYPTMGLPFTILMYVIVAMGGFGSIVGTLAAALLVGVAESLTALYLPPTFKLVFVFLGYLLIVLVRPKGLFGRF